AWSAPAGGPTPSGYNVYRRVDGGGLTRLTSSPVPGLGYSDTSPPSGQLCYQVAAVAGGVEGPASNAPCVSNVIPPPGAPLNLTATLVGAAPPAGATSFSPVGPGSARVALPDGVAPEVAPSALLQWQAPSSGGPVKGYHVYRSTGTGPFQKID